MLKNKDTNEIFCKLICNVCFINLEFGLLRGVLNFAHVGLSSEAQEVEWEERDSG